MAKITAKQFYDRIKNKSKYKLVNGLFIVKYVGNGNYQFIGNFYKKGRYGATKEKSYVKVNPTRQLFNPSKKLVRTNLGVWKKLNISFKIKPISEILK